MGPCLFYQSTSFVTPHYKTQCTMLVDNVSLKICLLGTLNSKFALTFFPWYKLKWSRDKFNNQSHISHGLWDQF